MKFIKFTNFEENIFMSVKVFRTVIEPKKYDYDINHRSKLLFIGSCFTENIGNILNALKFNIDINPFGILYNPVSVYHALKFINDNKTFSEDDLFYFNERRNSWYHHGRFSSKEIEQTLNNINNRITAANNTLVDSDYIFITFGTAWVYKLKETEQIVSNCHKVPAEKFEKSLLSVEDISNLYSEILKKLQSVNKKLKIIFTVSPVRHLKDGFEENFLSKSILRTAINKIIKNFDGCYYFPSYEIVIDDLRDYRFFNSDMVHPSDVTVDYIYNYFKTSFFNDETISLNERIQKIIRAKKHRPFDTESEAYSKFKKKTFDQINNLKEEHPYIDLREETELFK